MNTLYYGDCLTIMREKMQPESVDLVYLDPPFNSKRDYNSIYKDHTGRPLPDQVEAYTDTWFLDNERMRAIKALPALLREHGVDGHSADFLAHFISGLTQVQPDMAAYLGYMTERLLWIKWTMKPTASIYLHCDPTASHYLKIVMDVVFGRKNFMNEVIWHYGKWTNAARHFQKNHDVLLAYAFRFGKHCFNKLHKQEESYHYEKGWHTNTIAGGISQLIVYDKVKATKKIESGIYDKIVYREGKTKAALPDVWDIPILNPMAKERLDYATQKPLALLNPIIRASSNEGDVVFDPFCGCATTIEAAEKLKRRWIGCDITIHAIRRVARRRLTERLHLQEGKDYRIDGVPKNWEGAQALWRQDPYQFQKWCVELVEGFVNVKKTADDGIDGRVYFDMPGEKVFQSMALEVKGGRTVGPSDVGYLNSVLQYENIQMAGLITLHAPGAQQARNFQRKMALAGDVAIGDRLYPRMQMLTVAEILAGAKFDMPSPAGRSGTGYERDLFTPAPGA